MPCWCKTLHHECPWELIIIRWVLQAVLFDNDCKVTGTNAREKLISSIRSGSNVEEKDALLYIHQLGAWHSVTRSVISVSGRLTRQGNRTSSWSESRSPTSQRKRIKTLTEKIMRIFTKHVKHQNFKNSNTSEQRPRHVARDERCSIYILPV